MSKRWGVRSKGKPYFCFRQVDLSYMDVPNIGDGPLVMSLDLALHSLPKKNAADDEIHQMFSFSGFPLGATALAIGVTPSGRLAAIYPSGETFMTATGFMVPNSVYQTIQLSVDLFGNVFVTVDTQDAISEIAVTPTLPLPVGDKLGQVMLFNGSDALTRCECSIREAFVQFYYPSTGGVKEARYYFGEGFGGSLAATMFGSSDSPNQNFNLEATSSIVPPSKPWGVPEEVDIGTLFKWELTTKYTRKPQPITTYRRRV